MIESPETLADDYFLGMYKCGWWSYHYSLIRQVWDSEDYQSLMLLLKRVLYYVANRNRFNLDIKCKFHFLISFFFFFCLTSTLRQLWKEPGKDWSEALSAKSPCLLSVGGDPKNSVPEYNRTLEMYSLHTSWIYFLYERKQVKREIELCQFEEKWNGKFRAESQSIEAYISLWHVNYCRRQAFHMTTLPQVRDLPYKAL